MGEGERDECVAVHVGMEGRRGSGPTSLQHCQLLQVSATEKNNIGMVVIRGNSIVMMEALEKLWGEPGGGGIPPR